MATNGLIKNKNWFIFPTLKGYKISWLTFDIIAGVTLAAVAIPEQMATAQLAGMPVDGLSILLTILSIWSFDKFAFTM